MSFKREANWVGAVQPKVALERPKPSPTALLPFGGAEQVPVDSRAGTPAGQKTRGVTGDVEVDAEHLGSTDDGTAVRPIPVSARVYKVLATLFNTGKESVPC